MYFGTQPAKMFSTLLRMYCNHIPFYDLLFPYTKNIINVKYIWHNHCYCCLASGYWKVFIYLTNLLFGNIFYLYQFCCNEHLPLILILEKLLRQAIWWLFLLRSSGIEGAFFQSNWFFTIYSHTEVVHQDRAVTAQSILDILIMKTF